MNDTIWGLKHEEISNASEALLRQLSALGELVVARENLPSTRGNTSLRTNPSNPAFAGQMVVSSTIPLSTAAAKAALAVELTAVVGIAVDRAIELNNQLDYLIEALKKVNNG